MKVIQGEYAGFCPGVKRAWEKVKEATRDSSRPVFILGELVHNQQAIKELEGWGVKMISDLEQIGDKKATVIIRAHGEPPKTFERLKRMENVWVIDATCPNVSRAQKLARQLSDEGYQVVVCGEKSHAEALATTSYTKGGIIISFPDEAEKLPAGRKIGVLSQTTFSPFVFEKICQILKKKAKQLELLGTMCNFTNRAQKEAREIAERVDLVIVVGGRHSSNTKRLAEVAEDVVPTYHIETAKEIKGEWLNKKVKKVGLLAGASTPDWTIREARKRLEES